MKRIELNIMKRLILLVVLLAISVFNSFETMSQDKSSLSFIALGDSYTVGEAVEQENSWPYLLAMDLDAKGIKLNVEKVIATTGWTTDELLASIDKQEAKLLEKTYDVVSLLIGVNNQYRGYSIEQYKKEFEVLLKKAITLAGGKNSHVFIVSIPDYGVTPFVKQNDKDAKKIATDLVQYNTIARELAEENQVVFFDITPISLKAIYDKSYIAKDGLHPSGKMYKEWVNYFSSALSRQISE